MPSSVWPSAQRGEYAQDGILTRSCFSAGRHYDPDNIAFGPIIGCDEHRVVPGAGFARHTHRGVEIVSVVLSGVLRHEGPEGVNSVGPGELLWQASGSGLEHVEANGGPGELHFVQTTFLSERTAPAWAVASRLVSVPGGQFAVREGLRDGIRTAGRAHVYVADGTFELAGRVLTAGDSLRGDEPLGLAGSGRLLVWTADRLPSSHDNA